MYIAIYERKCDVELEFIKKFRHKKMNGENKRMQYKKNETY